MDISNQCVFPGSLIYAKHGAWNPREYRFSSQAGGTWPRRIQAWDIGNVGGVVLKNGGYPRLGDWGRLHKGGNLRQGAEGRGLPCGEILSARRPDRSGEFLWERSRS